MIEVGDFTESVEMIKKIIVVCGQVSFNRAFAQHERLDQITDSTPNEGRSITYRSEWALMPCGSDIFLRDTYTALKAKTTIGRIFFLQRAMISTSSINSNYFQ